MNVIDIVLGIFLIIGLVRGFQRGFIIELTSIIALFAGIFGALNYAYFAESYFEKWFDWNENTIEIAGFLATFVIILIGVSIIGKILTKIINTIALGTINRILGGIFGVLKTGLIIIVLLMIFSFFNGNNRFIDNQKIESSLICSTMAEITPLILPSLETFIENNLEDDNILNSDTE
ncbi:CvpA family protein [Psychroflexus aestuariivivens]|uniref:CvpA family protein n=1 Tax=Psychroflexus aestuariivivens TaxID=1795040 RepID=UPI000FD7A93E|nr:CvpA family protein [Psychroflexus aestuariivivens]